MSYIKSSLIKDELIVSRFPLHWSAWLPVVFCVAVAIGPLVIGMLTGSAILMSAGVVLFFVGLTAAIIKTVRLMGIERAVTSLRLVQKRGIVSRESDEIQLTSIETVEISQSVLDRILGAGAVKATGRGISDLVLSNVDDPLVVKKLIESVA